MIENRVHQVREYVKAAKQANVKFILLLSIINCEVRGNAMTRQFAQIEDIVEGSGIPCSFLRSNFYMENLLFQAPALAEGKLMLPLGNGKLNLVALEDVANASAHMMVDPEKFVDKAFDLNGKEAVTGEELAEHFSHCIEEDVEYQNCSVDDYVRLLSQMQVPEWLASNMAGYIQSFQTDHTLEDMDCSDFYQDLTHDQQTTMSMWHDKHHDELQQSIQHYKQQQQGQQVGTSSQKQGQKQAQASSQRHQQGQPSTYHPHRQRAGQQEVSLDKLKNLLHELISERSQFSHEEQEAIKTNETRLQSLHQMEKTIKKIEQSSHSSQEEHGRLGKSESAFGKPLKTLRN
jgi:hypothetical protein